MPKRNWQGVVQAAEESWEKQVTLPQSPASVNAEVRGGVRKDEDQIVTEVRGYEWAVPGERGRPSEHSVFF